MISDVWTVMQKEWREFLAGASVGGSGRGRGVVGVLLIVGILSIFLPLKLGHELFTTGAAVIIDGIYLPFIVLLNLIADSFAGERERHTLETLLSSRLSDRAILFGKVAAAVAYGWAVGLLGALVQAIVANLTQKSAGGDEGLSFYPPDTVLAIVVLGLLMSALASSAGCLVSLRSATTRQAQLNLGFGFLVLVFVPVIGFQLLPDQTQASIIAQLNSASPSLVFLIIAGALVAINAVLLTIALLLFQRSRLIGQ